VFGALNSQREKAIFPLTELRKGRTNEMAYLTECSLCGRNTSSESKCLGCGHDVAGEERKRQKEAWKKNGQCLECGGKVISKHGYLRCTNCHKTQ